MFQAVRPVAQVLAGVVCLETALGILSPTIAGQFVVVESWLNDKATNQNRGRIFSLYMAVSWAASGVSPLALNLADPTGHELFTLAAVALVTSLVPLGLTGFGNPEIGERNQFGVRKLFGLSPLGVVACFGSGMATPA